MIRIYGIQLDDLRLSADEILSVLPSFIAEPWQRRHPNLREQKAKKASLAGVWLLFRAKPDARLAYTDDGKPFLRNEGTSIGITHTKSYAFCAVSDEGGEIGLDAEELGRLNPDRISALAARWFTKAEQERLQSEQGEEIFLDIWTKKEALVKRTGEGLRVLRESNSKEPQADVSFASYRYADTILSLAYPKNQTPPTEIIFYHAESY